ncbi:MFS transporter [Pseudothermotoga hypogea DSM 11164 = NBRC 106472]|uniref:MFS transporter n=1 Tax=Pseudothermotoga hypogea DSM 11164 = NBRC 106472 TaxID=1123384 RepID=A0A0X1KQJ1_9THEM|nr:pyridoxamine 5'-phosphate oxidase family protein [Pseudothermotoga hypogea]AJC73489.1 MFS transporter [Pseudothermotoga hypogea DSM 11164 = NBRC 106472]MBC7121811.1 pyridoxamine 5'-phosphate oxidase family protein [Pseudothermotoga sp.]
MGKYFKPLRRKDRALKDDEALEILSKSNYGVLCVFDGNYPYGVPVNYVYEDGFIYIHSAKEGHKIESIKSFDRVCFTVVGSSQVMENEFSTKYESVVVFGRADILHDEQVIPALRKLAQKYSPRYTNEAERIIQDSFKDVAVIRIKIEHVQGKANR